MSVDYTIEVITGAFRHSGTMADVHLILHGTLANSDVIVLNQGLQYKLATGKAHIVQTKQADLGDIWGAQFIKFDKGAHAEWLLDTYSKIYL